MRLISPALQTHLNMGTTTLCNCWRMRLKSGETFGFTDHDNALSFDGTVFEAAAGFTGSEIESSLGFSVDNLEAKGALQSSQLDEARLRNGDFDHADVEVWRVNWSDPSQRVLQRKGHLGEVTTGNGGFEAEVRGLAHLLNQPQGRVYQFGCDAILGDVRCGIDLNAAGFSDAGTVVSLADAELVLSGIGFVDEWATRGSIGFTSGAGAGKTLSVRRHRLISGQTRVSLWATPTFSIVAGDAVILRAGCDKQFTTCRAKFSNGVNFRGFPHMPGTDFVFSSPLQGDSTNDGGKRN
jgi:uncharacterized phage protein (TIGR02218 family)